MKPDTMHSDPMHSDDSGEDRLARIFAMQRDLNDYVFRNHGLTGPDGEVLSMEAIFAAVAAGELGVNDAPAVWLRHYSKAMMEEARELREELPWKWWSKDHIDLQNIRVELIDILHFLVSAMISAGLTPEKVYDIYRQKHAVNVRRQDSDYSRASKDDADNRGIG